MENCLFCKIVEGTIPAKKVYEDEDVVVIEDISPVAPVHLLIITREHIINANDLKEEHDALIGRVHRTVARIAQEKGIAEDGYRIVNNTNAGGGQSVFHIHFHLLGGRNLGWPPG